MPLNEEAFRDAVAVSEAAFERESSAVGALVGRDRAFRALLRAYLSHPAIRKPAYSAVVHGGDINTAVDDPMVFIVEPILQSIGAEEPKP